MSIAEIRDGTSNTLLGSELILVPDGPVGSDHVEDIRGRYHNVRHAGALFSTRYPPNTSEPDRFNDCLSVNPRAPCTYSGTNVIVSAQLSPGRGYGVDGRRFRAVPFRVDRRDGVPRAGHAGGR